VLITSFNLTEPPNLGLCLFGAAPDTGNLGVSALCYSTLAGLLGRHPSATITCFDHRRGIECQSLTIGNQNVRIVRAGGFHSRRFYQRESLWNMRVSGWLGGAGNRNLARLTDADVALDFSGGDSFTDLHGLRRFRAVTLPKTIALEQRVPLILMPQTFGPFLTSTAKETARRVLRQVRQAWTRDEKSMSVIRELLGNEFDPSRHRLGVDVAFSLPATDSPNSLNGPISEWRHDDQLRVAGINVSGLLYNDDERIGHRYRLRASYRETIRMLVERLLVKSDWRVVLVPHVVGGATSFERDLPACEAVFEECRHASDGRLAVLPEIANPCHVKGVIQKFDWFCGTRMHSCIAAISSGVPTTAIAYSVKTSGVFATCGLGENVVDPRESDTPELVDSLWQCWRRRHDSAHVLRAVLPGVLRQAEEQMDDILNICAEASEIRSHEIVWAPQ